MKKARINHVHEPEHGRYFLQSTAAIAASLLLLQETLRQEPDQAFHFIHVDTLNSWSVAEPVRWALENADQPILERASERLAKLTPNDGDRIIRLVVRRCRLNLVEVQSKQVVVHHWGQKRAEHRPFFKTHGLARKEIEVVLRDRKKEVVTTQHRRRLSLRQPACLRFRLGTVPEQMGTPVRE